MKSDDASDGNVKFFVVVATGWAGALVLFPVFRVGDLAPDDWSVAGVCTPGIASVLTCSGGTHGFERPIASALQILTSICASLQ